MFVRSEINNPKSFINAKYTVQSYSLMFRSPVITGGGTGSKQWYPRSPAPSTSWMRWEEVGQAGDSSFNA